MVTADAAHDAVFVSIPGAPARGQSIRPRVPGKFAAPLLHLDPPGCCSGCGPNAAPLLRRGEDPGVRYGYWLSSAFPPRRRETPLRTFSVTNAEKYFHSAQPILFK